MHTRCMRNYDVRSLRFKKTLNMRRNLCLSILAELQTPPAFKPIVFNSANVFAGIVDALYYRQMWCTVAALWSFEAVCHAACRSPSRGGCMMLRVYFSQLGACFSASQTTSSIACPTIPTLLFPKRNPCCSARLGRPPASYLKLRIGKPGKVHRFASNRCRFPIGTGFGMQIAQVQVRPHTHTHLNT